MLLILWAPSNPKAHDLDIVFANGVSMKAWTLIPGGNAIDWAEGINLPASAVVTPLEFAIRKPAALPSYKFRFFGVWLIGILCWYMVGRFVGDLLQWRSTRTLPRKNAMDLGFALIATPSAVLLAKALPDAGRSSPILAVWAVIWLGITSADLLFRVAQEIRQRRRPAVH